MSCDVLAGDQSPSCRSTDQVPDAKVIHIRFIKGKTVEVEDEGDNENTSPTPKKKQDCVPHNSVPTFSGLVSRPTQSSYPKSISLATMLKLGKSIEDTSTSVEIFPFNMQDMTWPTCGEHADFTIARKPSASGGFCEAYEASSDSARFKANKWVNER